MSEDLGREVAEADVAEKGGISAVWIIPLLAVLIGAFLVYRTFADAGPTIAIQFKTAAGLEAGKTKVKFKDVEVGLVRTIDISDDLSHVVVTAELAKTTEPYLTESTRFWVVRAQVSAGRVTALGTLFAGAYIGMDPSSEGGPRREFVGLETQPIVTSDEPGRMFLLESALGGSYQMGSPVYFRRVQVGEVVSSRLDDTDGNTEVQIFVRAPHDERVRTDTRFWNASGFDLSMSAEGLRVDTPSVTSLLIGGISFETPPALESGEEVPKDHVFRLHANRETAFSRAYAIKQRYRLEFLSSVEGLVAGAAVVFNGIQIGEVLDVRLHLDVDTLEFTVPVMIQLEPERIVSRAEVSTEEGGNIRAFVEKGLRARLKSGNLLTGQKQVELVMLEDAPPVEVAKVDGLYQIPTVPTPLDALTSNVARIVERLNAMPIEDIGENLDRSLIRLAATLENTAGLTERLNDEIVPNLATASRDASALLSPDSTVSTELRKLLVELNEAARSMRLLGDYLERHPEALIRGKEGE
jgi:paraquat-inducible protein B